MSLLKVPSRSNIPLQDRPVEHLPRIGLGIHAEVVLDA
jgi:hypothetical protein